MKFIKTILITLLLFSFTNVVNGQRVVKQQKLKLKKTYYKNGKINIYAYVDENGIYNGEFIWYNEEGQKVWEGKTKDNKWVGFWNHYSNGILDSKAEHNTGNVVANGKAIFYYTDGIKKSEGVLNAGAKTGFWKLYHRNGTLKSEGEYIARFKRPIKTGLWKHYHKNGKLEMIGKYNNNESVGEWKTYYKTGELESKGSYNNEGVEVGEWIYYHKNGKIQGIENYINGKLNGAVKTYYDNGKTECDEKYVNGKNIGKMKCFNKNGTPSIDGQYGNDGKRTGKWLFYDKSGKLKKQTNY